MYLKRRGWHEGRWKALLSQASATLILVAQPSLSPLKLTLKPRTPQPSALTLALKPVYCCAKDSDLRSGSARLHNRLQPML